MSSQPSDMRMALMHPVDEMAQKYLGSRMKPGSRINSWVDSILTHMENQFYFQNLADNLRVTPTSNPRLHKLMERASNRIGQTNIPLYLDTNSVPNAWTLGDKKPGVVITHGLVSLLDDEETVFVLGHEIGHIAAQHVRYRLMLMQFGPVLALMSLIPFIGIAFALAFQIALSFWYRRSELTSDRFGLIACDNPTAALSALTKLAGGEPDSDSEAIVETMMEQAEEFRTLYHENPEQSMIWDIYDGLLADFASRTHPWGAVRVWELNYWMKTDHYSLARAGRWKEAEKVRSETPSFFQTDITPGDDPLSYVMKEATGELGKDVSKLVSKGLEATDELSQGVSSFMSKGRDFFKQKE